MYAARQLAQLRGGFVQLLERFVDQLNSLVGSALDPFPRQAQVDAERHQALLGAVVEVSLDPAPLLVTGLNDARARCPQLDEIRAKVGVQALVFQCQRRRGSNGPHELVLFSEVCDVHDRGDAPSLVFDDRHDLPSGGRVDSHGLPIFSDVLVALRHPVGQLQAAVAERLASASRKAPRPPPLLSRATSELTALA